MEIPRTKHAAVVGQGERGHFEFCRLTDQVAQAIRAVEKRVFRVCVEVYEAHE